MATVKQQYALAFVRRISSFVAQYQELIALEDEFVRLGYGSGAPNAITDGDLAGLNLELTADDIAGGMVTLDAIKTLMGQGHGTNLYKLFRRGV